MVHLIENYYAIPNNMGFTLAQDNGRTDKEGNPLYDTVGYCGNFEEVIFLLKRKVVGDKLQDGCIELSEALTVILETTGEIKQAMKGIEV